MRVIATLFIVVVALMAGAMGGYVYRQAEVTDLADQVARLEVGLARAESEAATAVREVQSMRVELAARMKLADDQQAKIAELLSALASAPPPAPPAGPAGQTGSEPAAAPAPGTPASGGPTPEPVPPLPPPRP